MINILIITFLVVAIIIGFTMLSMCDVIKDTDRRNKEIKQNQLKNKRMLNAEPEEYRRCHICGKKFTDGGVFKQYKNKWYCINCYLWVLNIENESFIKKVKAHFLEERKKQTESEKAGEE